MKTSFILVFPILFISFFAVNLAGAQTSCSSNAVCIENPIEADTFEELINAIIDFMWMFGIAVVPMVIIIAGYFFVTSMGDPAKVSQAKKMVLYALIGLLIIGMAKGIVTLIQEIFKW